MKSIVDQIKYETRDIKWLDDLFQANLLVVDNTFQRRFVWLPKHKVKFIETILEGFPAPEIYVWERNTNPKTGETSYSIIDGQQRITSVSDFIQGEFALEKKYVTEDLRNRDYVGKKFDQLKDDQRSRIWSYMFSVKFVKSSVSREQIVAMFLRLNKTNVTLNPQELRHAEFEGKFLNVAESIARDKVWKKYEVFTANQIRRMQDIQFISNLLIYCREGISAELSQKNLNEIYDAFNTQYEQAEADQKRIIGLAKKALALSEGHPNVLSLLKKSVHLYTLMIALDRMKKTSPKLVSKRYVSFVRQYQSDEPHATKELTQVAKAYREATLEGVQKRSNRTRRVELLKTWLESGAYARIKLSADDAEAPEDLADNEDEQPPQD